MAKLRLINGIRRGLKPEWDGFTLYPLRVKKEMRNYRNAITALTLALVLTMPAFAGIMHTEKESPTPSPVPAVAGIMTTDAPDGEGIMHTEAAESAPSETSLMIAEVAAALVQSVLTLF
jgi:hypothetical protein